MISVFDLFKIGIGPSSSHTVGPMRAAAAFVARLADVGLLTASAGVHVELFGSLGATGRGHGTVDAVTLGLQGAAPDTVDPDTVPAVLAGVREQGRLLLGGAHAVPFSADDDIVLHIGVTLPHHSNGMRFEALGADGVTLLRREYYSVGGGFVLDEDEIESTTASRDVPVPYPFATAVELLRMAGESGLSVSDLVLANEHALHPGLDVHADLM